MDSGAPISSASGALSSASWLQENWAKRRVFSELKTALEAAQVELKQLSASADALPRIQALEEQFTRLGHLLEHIEELQRTKLEIHLITQIALKLANALDLDEVLNLIVDSLKQVVDYDAAGIFLVSEDKKVIEGEILRGYEDVDPNKVHQKLGQGLMGWVLEHMAPVLVNDVSRDPRYVNSRPKTRSELVVPMFTGGKVIGCFNLESDKLAGFNRNDVNHLMTFASHAAVAIERARLYRESLEKQRIDEELAIARRMQRSLLPRRPPILKGFELAAVNVPSEMVGGDYYDFISFTDKDLGIVVGDVAGKGVPAAFIMASLRASLRIEVSLNYSIARSLKKVNDFLYEFIEPERFVTAFYGVLDTQSRSLTYCNAGHNPPMLLHADGSQEFLTEGGLLLGAFAEAQYQEHNVSFASGDLLILYTDGVSEAENPEDEQFGLERIAEVARSSAQQGAREVIRNLLKAVRLHRGKTALQDDLTLMVLQCR